MGNKISVKDKVPFGPISYENWQAKVKGNSMNYASEFPLFTDTHITGEMTEGCGPYQLLNTVPVYRKGTIAPSIILRIDEYLDEDPVTSEMSKTDTARYHGGWFADEIAALFSLCLGMRLKAGGCIRRFESDGDPRGHPEMHSLHLDPILIKPQGFKPILPNAIGTHCINDAHLIKNYCDLSSVDAIALIKAARIYQDAIWIAESNPAFAWVYLVSAIETAANHWKKEKESAVARLGASQPQLETLLLEYGGSELLHKVADQVSDYMGATRKFIDFILHYLPKAPEIRPPEFARHEWESQSLKNSLRTIYNCRSRSLHSGIPFPEPMCNPPMKQEHGFWEKPLGLASSSKGAVWLAKDTPMLLHLFEYIVRNALLLWWESIKSKAHNAANSADAKSGAAD